MSAKISFRAGILVLCLYAIVVLCASVSSAAVSFEPRFAFARDGDGIVGALLGELPEGYHSYAHEPGDAGRPTTLRIFLKEGEPFPVLYPRGAMQRDYYDPEATVQVYEGSMRLFFRLPPDAAGKSYRASLSMLMCSSKNCLPYDQSFSGVVPRKLQKASETEWFPALMQAREEGGVILPPEGDGAFGLADAGNAPSQPGSGVGMSTQPMASGRMDLSSFRKQNKDVSPSPVGEEETRSPLPPPPDFSIQLEPSFATASLEIFGLGKALLLGILAGLLLNVMPCVLPVLTFKVTGLLMTAKDGKAGLARFRQHNLFFAAGVMTLFTVLAIVLGAMDLMWGQLYQSQEFLLIMLLLVFLMGLSLLGVFSLPVIDIRAGKSRNPRMQAYLTGLLSTFLATPCSGPLLGGVLGWAFTQPLPVLVVVFWSVGLGMSFPYLFLSAFPKFARALPHAGPWMHVFEQILGFLLMGTCLYLLSILPVAIHLQVITSLLIVSLAAYLWGQFCGSTASVLRRRLGSLLLLGILAGAVVFALRTPEPELAWKQFQPHEFVEALGKRPMVVEITADWCPNCKFVEATVFTDRRLKALRQKYDVDFVRVDLTGANAYGVKLLGLLGSRSIPLTALFPAGDGAMKPLVLRDVFSASTLEAAAKKTFAISHPLSE